MKTSQLTSITGVSLFAMVGAFIGIAPAWAAPFITSGKFSSLVQQDSHTALRTFEQDTSPADGIPDDLDSTVTSGAGTVFQNSFGSGDTFSYGFDGYASGTAISGDLAYGSVGFDPGTTDVNAYNSSVYVVEFDVRPFDTVPSASGTTISNPDSYIVKVGNTLHELLVGYGSRIREYTNTYSLVIGQPGATGSDLLRIGFIDVESGALSTTEWTRLSLLHTGQASGANSIWQVYAATAGDPLVYYGDVNGRLPTNSGGIPNSWILGDINTPGSNVTLGNFDNFQAGLAVPEPTSLTLLAICGMVLSRRRRR